MPVILFSSFIFATFVTLFGYFWGNNNHISHIPITLRIINPEFLTSDFYLNSAFFSSQRFYYAFVIGFFVRILGLKYAFLFLTFLVNFLNVFLISLFTDKVFRSKKSAILSGFLSTQPLIEIGGASFLTLNYLIPHLMAVTFAIAGIYFCFFSKYYWSVISFIIASLIHPQLGLMTGLLTLFIFFLIDTVVRKNKFFFNKLILINKLLPIGFFLLFILFYVPSFKIGQNLISDKEAISINIFFRNPHHHLLYTIDKITWFITLAFLLIIFLVLFYFKKQKKFEKLFLFSSMMITGVLLLVVIGFFFTEVYPVKVIAFAQTLRLFYLIKFLGIILMAGYFSMAKYQTEFLSGLYSPISILFYLTFEMVKEKVAKIKLISNQLSIFYYLGLFVIIFWLIDVDRMNRSTFIFLAIFFVLLFFYSLKKYFYFAGFFIFFLLISFLFFQPNRFLVQKWLGPYKPKIEFSYSHPEMPYLAEYVKKNTEKDAVFLTPPDFGQLRFLGERAIVVDFKAFIFNEKMKEWYQRIIDIYGKPSSFYYYFIVEDLNKNYKSIDDQKIYFLKKKYHFDYGILFKETKTDFPVVYSYGNYKIVDVNF